MREGHSPALVSSVPFASFLTYSPRGTSEVSVNSRRICHQIKQDGPSAEPPASMIEYAVRRLGEEAASYPFLRDFLADDVLLVPMPRSAPMLPGKAVLWVPLTVCATLNEAGFGGVGTLIWLERTEPVRKSAWAGPGQRPMPKRHLETMVAAPGVEAPEIHRVTIVDDVITKGATAIAAASLLKAAVPKCRGPSLRARADYGPGPRCGTPSGSGRGLRENGLRPGPPEALERPLSRRAAAHADDRSRGRTWLSKATMDPLSVLEHHSPPVARQILGQEPPSRPYFFQGSPR